MERIARQTSYSHLNQLEQISLARLYPYHTTKAGCVSFFCKEEGDGKLEEKEQEMGE